MNKKQNNNFINKNRFINKISDYYKEAPSFCKNISHIDYNTDYPYQTYRFNNADIIKDFIKNHDLLINKKEL